MKNIIKNKNSKGFTLVETLIYVLLFAILSIFLINTLLVMLRSYTEVRVNDDILDAAHTSMERMTREIRGSASSTITSITSTSSSLLLNTTDASGTAITEQFDATSSALEFRYNGTVSGNLTGSHVSVTSLIFRGITTTAGYAIRIEMIIQSLRSPTNKSMLFTDTVALRGSY